MVLLSIFIQYLTLFMGSHSIHATEADLGRKSHAVDFDNSSDAQTNDNFSAAQADSSPIISAGKKLPINQQPSDAVKETSPSAASTKQTNRRLVVMSAGREFERKHLKVLVSCACYMSGTLS